MTQAEGGIRVAKSPKRPRTGRQLARFLTRLPVVVLAFLLVVGAVVNPAVSFDPPWLLPPLSFVFLTVIPLVGAAVAIDAYRRTGVGAVLGVGAGMLAIGLGGGLLPAILLFTSGQNATVTLHNVAALLSGLCNFVAAVAGILGASLGRRRTLHVVMAYGLVAASVLATFGLEFRGLTPPFWTEHGASGVRQGVLGAATILFGLAAFAWWQTDVRDRRIPFLTWYVPGLALFALGLAGVYAQTVVGGLVGWIGRTGQYAGMTAMLVAVALQASRRRGGGDARSLGVALLQAALPFRSLVESTSDAVVAVGRERSGRLCERCSRPPPRSPGRGCR